MQWVKGLCLFGLSFGVVFCVACVASAAEVSFVSNPLWLSTTKTTEGESVQASTVITKQGAEAISGTVTFYANGKELGATDFSLSSGVGGVVVALSFVPEKGTSAVSAKITHAVVGDEAITVTGEAKAGVTLVVEPDNDRDKIADATDPDDDNDGISDADEKKNGTDPLKKEVVQSAAPSVAGATTSTGDFVGQATSVAKNTGSLLFAKTEGFRLSAGDYFDTKIAEAEAVRKAKQAAAGEEMDLDERLVAGPKPFMEQLKDTSGLFEGIKIQAYKVLAFIFGNVYAFYIVIILFVLWLLRKVWRRHSLD